MTNPWPVLRETALAEDYIVIGVDEAGRGPLFGPVLAGAAALPISSSIDGLACSKSLSNRKRALILPKIKSEALAWATAEASVEEIDSLNILQASLLAMHRAVRSVIEQIGEPESRFLVLVDGNKTPKWTFNSKAIVKGDVWVPAISAGSILAKETRDAWCMKMAEQFPGYGLEQHMGYPTKLHMQALQRYGCTPYHRKSFGPVKACLARPEQSELF